MATIYVDSNAAGANNGTSWTDAYTSFINAGVLAATGGTDEVWVASDHVEAAAGALDINFTGTTEDDPLELFSMDKTDDSYSAGATVNTTASAGLIEVKGSLRFFGINIQALTSGNLTLCRNVDDVQHFRDATISLGDLFRASQNTETLLVFENMTFTSTETGTTKMLIFNESRMVAKNSVFNFTNTIAGDSMVNLSGDNQSYLFEDCAFPDVTNICNFAAGGRHNSIILRRCSLNSGFVPVKTEGQIDDEQTFILIEGSNSDTDATPLGLQYFHHKPGVIQSDLTRYRTNGADDDSQANAHSWLLVANTESRESWRPLRSPPITIWVKGGSEITIPVYVAGTATLQNNQCWMELSGPDDAATSTTRGHFATTRAATKATPANLTTDTDSTWNGSDVGTMQKMDITYTPDQDGPITVRVCLAASAGATLSVDPFLGGKKQFFVHGTQRDELGGGLFMHSGMEGGLKG